METVENIKNLNERDALFIEALKTGNREIYREFFRNEIGGILRKINFGVFRGKLEFDELVNELYLYLSRGNWASLDKFDGRNGCRLRSWIIPVAWRFFVSNRDRLMNSCTKEFEEVDVSDNSSDDFRIQIAIDVNAVLSRMPNRRYSEIIRLLLIEGFAPKDVAEMLDIRVENVYNLKCRAVNQFIEIYGPR